MIWGLEKNCLQRQKRCLVEHEVNELVLSMLSRGNTFQISDILALKMEDVHSGV